jgi:hypothetical protein
MDYITTGAYRHASLRVLTTVDGESSEQVFVLLNGFYHPATNEFHPGITPLDFQRLPESVYQHRLAQFIDYVATRLPPGFDFAAITNKASGQSAEDGVLACADNR